MSRAEPLDGHFRDVRDDLLGLLRRAAAEGDQRLIRLSFGPFPFLIVNNPEAIKFILTDPERIFVKPKMDLWKRLLGESVLTSDGQQWLRSRKRTVPVLGPSYVQRHARVVSETTDERVRSWTSESTIDVLQEMRFITLSSSLRSLCGINRGVDVSSFTAGLSEIMKYIQLREASPRDAEVDDTLECRYLAAVASLRESVERALAAHPGGTDDLITRLLTHRDFRSGRLTVAQVCDDVLAHLVAGYESTATALAWTFLLIARHPAVEPRLREEIARTVGSVPPEVPDLDRMPYLHGVFAEALRLYPPTWGILRASARAFELDGVQLPKGTCTVTCQYTVHRDRRWFEQPDDFIPERWLETAPASTPKFAYFPFGGGRRACPGRRMGQTTAYTLITRVLQQFCLDPIDGAEVKTAVDVTLHPEEGARIRVRRISPSGAGGDGGAAASRGDTHLVTDRLCSR